jgi:ATP-binding cassette, subfamily B, bacterial MsbA
VSQSPTNWTFEVANKRPPFWPTLRGISAYLGSFRWGIAAVVGCGIAASIMELVTIGLLMPLLQTLMGRDALTIDGHPALAEIGRFLSAMTAEERVRLLLLTMLATQIAKEVVVYLNVMVCLRVNAGFAIKLRQVVFERIVDASLMTLAKIPTTRHFSALNGFSHNAADLMLSVMKVIVPILAIAVYFGMMLMVSPELTAIAAGIVGVVLILTTFILSRQRRWFARAVGDGANMTHVALELLSAIRIVKTFGREPLMRARQNAAVGGYWRSYFKSQKYANLVGPFGQILGMTGFVAIFIVGTYLLPHEGAYWIEKVLLFLFILARLSTPASQLNTVRAEIAGRIAGAGALLDYLDLVPATRAKRVGLTTFDTRADLRFESVSFAYAAEGPPTVADLNFVLPYGRKTAIVGESGAGKSTIVDLLLKHLTPSMGRIAVGKTDLAAIDDRAWRASVAVVSQDTYLFADTIRENIRFGRPDATDAEIERAAADANLAETLDAMPQGLDTWVGERGAQLSGGQAQRVAIARAILANPSLLVLDEATSAQDAVSERLIQDAIERLAENRTVLVIAHRLATVRSADEILVLDKGRIVERGVHSDLVKRGGRYARFVELQDLRA